MAARTEAPFGTADTVAQQSTALARDLLDALESSGTRPDKCGADPTRI
jgi:hypothetical protein